MSASAALRRDAPRLVSDFLDDLQEPRPPYISPECFARRSGLSQGALARLAGVHRNTVRLNPASEALQNRIWVEFKLEVHRADRAQDAADVALGGRSDPGRPTRHALPIGPAPGRHEPRPVSHQLHGRRHDRGA